MHLTTTNYNTLGRIGSHYERPEYRPPQEPVVNDSASRTQPEKVDRSTLSTKNTHAAAKSAPLTVPTGKLSLAAAKNLSLATSYLIDQLSPVSTSSGPHNYLPTSLMPSFYA